ncbi:MAG: nucleotidyltransferase family protein [Deltaproteobacteria bacterium]|nr:nucleotidyltransferase family protein [Deltaproteobacteria bacterium]MBW2677297.1 nucleotidyltransferase family protein [Deltaproteobacteria bacterium]
MECKTPTAGIVLAAGTSSRFGKLKQLQVIDEKSLLEWTLDACLGSQLEHIFVVLGFRREKIIQALSRKFRNPRITVVFNPDYRNGQSTSLHAGIHAAKHAYSSVMFVLGDQPFIDCVTLDILLERFLASGKNICVPFYNGKRGNPVIFSKKFYAEITHIEGDVGARRIIDDNPSQVLSIALSRPSFFYDVDTIEDIEKMCALKKVDE